MLYICLPVYNEAPTVGVLLWRIRATFQEYTREYELVVYDDGSSDATAEVLEPYRKVLPLTILAGGTHLGYAAAVDALCRHVAAHTRYPRRDAMVLMQGDFTDRPEHLPELAKRFEGGADLVVTERTVGVKDPTPARRLGKLAPWLLRPFTRLDGVRDLTSSYRLVRISAIRDALRERGDAPLVSAPSVAAANAQLLLALAPFARRMETLAVEPRYDVRPRESRIRLAGDALALVRFGWTARSRGTSGVMLREPATRPVPEPPRETAPALVSAGVSSEPTAARDEATTASRRRKRGRQEAADVTPNVTAPHAEEADAAGDGEPRTRSRAAKRRRRSERSTNADDAQPTESTAALAPEIEALQDAADATDAAEMAERRKRRRARRGERRPPRDGGAESTESSEPSAGLASEDSGDVESSATDDESVTRGEGEATEGAPTRTRRRRRSRKRRTGAAPDAADGASEAGASDAQTSGDATDSGAGDSDGGESADASSDGAAPRARRSRRGKRRGRRSASEGGAGPDGGDSSADGAVDRGADRSADTGPAPRPDQA